jgi:RNA polymerase sigma factor (sigma-70 family)
MGPHPPERRALSPDQAAYRAVAAGDRDAFEAFHTRLGPWIRRHFLERSGGRMDVAEDLSQKTWTGVWQAVAARRYDPERSALSTFVYAVAQNVWRQHMRRVGRAGPTAEFDEQSQGALPGGSPDGTGVEDEAALAELLEVIRRALRGDIPGMTEADVQVLGLIARGMSDRDLAAALGVAPSTAHARKRATLDKLRGQLGGLGRGDRPVTPTSAPMREDPERTNRARE